MRWICASLLVASIGPAAWAANVCNETVPSDRVIDGIPAYQQCTDTTNSAIYSNNGVDTATTSAGADWVKTQGNGGYQCTELAHRYLAFKWAIKSVPNGNAGVWCDGSLPNGLEKATTPVHGDLIVFAPGSCGADSTTGHVAVIDVVNTNGTVTFVEQNRANRRSCAVSTAACFLHATANAASDGGVRDAATDTTAPPRDAGMGSEAPVDSRRRDTGASGGVTGPGSKSGTGGVDGTGGLAASGGAVSTGGQGPGGQSALGGATIVASGSGGTTVPSGSGPTAASDQGCACGTASGRPARAQPWLPWLALAVLVTARRRR